INGCESIARRRGAALSQVSAQRGRNGGIRRDVARLEGKPGKVLQYSAGLDVPPRQWIADVQLELRLGPPSIDLVAQIQLLRRIHDEAVVGHDLPGAHPAGDSSVFPQAGLDVDADECPSLPLIS